MERMIQMQVWKISGVPACLAGLMLLAGCYVKKEKDQERVPVIADKRVPSNMKGWIAVPDRSPELKNESEVSYAPLYAFNIIPASMDGWIAMSPALFEKQTGIRIPKVETPPVEPLKLEWDKKIPKDRDGWIAVEGKYPRTEMKDETTGVGEIKANQLVPVEMHGWAAVSRDTMAQIAMRHEQNKVTIPSKTK
jgi:hypothetical protein